MLSHRGHVPEVNQVVPNALDQPRVLIREPLEEFEARPDVVEFEGRMLVVELDRFGVDLLRGEAL